MPRRRPHATATSKSNLLAENVLPETIAVTGNTVIDALLWTVGRQLDYGDPVLDEREQALSMLRGAHLVPRLGDKGEMNRTRRAAATEPEFRIAVGAEQRPALAFADDAHARARAAR